VKKFISSFWFQVLAFAFWLIFVGLVSFSRAGAVDDLQRELASLQRVMDEERDRYARAKREMDRAELVARYFFDALRSREAEIKKQIEELEKK
jgi:hypothetical protein